MNRIYRYLPDTILECVKCRMVFPVGSQDEGYRTCPGCGTENARIHYSEDELSELDYGDNGDELETPAPEVKPKQPAKEVKIKDTRSDPVGLQNVIGNGAAIRWIETVLAAFRHDLAGTAVSERINHAFPHMLLSGPGGTGKTMISEIVAREIGRKIHLEMGQSMTNPARVGDILESLDAGDILYIDEMHGLKPVCQEALYRAMEDRVLIPVRRAGDEVLPPVQLPAFTIIGSTTDEWGLLPSLIQRFKVSIRMERLSPVEISAAMMERSNRMGIDLTDEAAKMIGERSHGTPRLAIGLLDSCVSTAKSQGERTIDFAVVEMTCELLGIDRLGLDSISRKYLSFLSEGDKPIRVNVLASKLDGLSRLTLERRIEPNLVWLGLIEKGSDGRRLTEKGRSYLK